MKTVQELYNENKLNTVFTFGNIVTLEFPESCVGPNPENGYKEEPEVLQRLTGMVYDTGIITTTGKVLLYDDETFLLSKDAYNNNIAYHVVEYTRFLSTNKAYALGSFIRVAYLINSANDASLYDKLMYKVAEV